MKRIKLDNAAPVVKQFVRGLPVGPNGVELELAGKVVGRVIPPTAIVETDRAALIARGRELVKRARARNRGVSARTLQREIRAAIADVRERRRQ